MKQCDVRQVRLCEISAVQMCTDTTDTVFQFLTAEQELELLNLMDQDEQEHTAHLPQMGVAATEPLAEEALPKKRGAPKGPRALPAPECRCMARVWGDGTGTQCKRR